MPKVLNLNQKCVTHNGVEYTPPTTYAEVLSDFLMESSEGDSRKLWDMSQRLSTKGKVQIDDSDIDKLIVMLENSKAAVMLKNGLKGPILKKLTELRLKEPPSALSAATHD